MNILILCTGNSCRSQIAQGWLKTINPSLNVHSAGTNPAKKVNPLAIEVMKESGVDISSQKPKSVDEYLGMDWDYVITVCDDAKETCPVFLGDAKHRLHYSFDDPSKAARNLFGMSSRESVLRLIIYFSSSMKKYLGKKI